MNKEFSLKQVLPCGVLTAGTQKYFLLHPEPISKDSWQRDEQQRWVVVPTEPLTDIYGKMVVSDNHAVYDYARHLVATNATIEYLFFETPIQIIRLSDGDNVDELEQPIPVELFEDEEA